MNLEKYIPQYIPGADINFDYQFTVFVPIYNRAETLHRVFNSMNAQTYRNFEVVIINDGSTDSSDETIKKFIKECTFEVVYVNNLVNKHKLGCIVEAVKIARGEFFLILDSDDECTPDALEVLLGEYDSIPADLKKNISGVTCCCIDQNGKLVGDLFPEDPFYNNSFEKKVYFDIKGEKWGFNKTSILKSIHIDNDVFGKGLIPESYIWFLISKEDFITKYVNKNLRIYYIDSNISLSNLGYEKKAFGMAVFALAFMNWFHEKHFNKAKKVFLMRLYSLLKASSYLEYKLMDYTGAIHNNTLKSMFVILWPFRKLL